jgi:hypothetical protein
MPAFTKISNRLKKKAIQNKCRGKNSKKMANIIIFKLDLPIKSVKWPLCQVKSSPKSLKYIYK